MKKRNHAYQNATKICQACGLEYKKKSHTGVVQWLKSVTCSRSCAGKMKPKPTLEKRKSKFWGKVDKSLGLGPNNDCWEWRGYTNINGYGIVRSGGKNYMTHRLSFEFENGYIDPDLYILHSCDNPPCVNPAHLRQGTHAENMNDMVIRGRTNAPRGINHYASTITDTHVRAIRKDQRPCSLVAKEYGVSASIVNGIRTMQKWKHITDEENWSPDDDE